MTQMSRTLTDIQYAKKATADSPTQTLRSGERPGHIFLYTRLKFETNVTEAID
jgi:hypothetical protein